MIASIARIENRLCAMDSLDFAGSQVRIERDFEKLKKAIHAEQAGNRKIVPESCLDLNRPSGKVERYLMKINGHSATDALGHFDFACL